MQPTVFSDPPAVWTLSPAELFYATKFGRIEKLMPPWRNSLDDEQIWQVVYYAWICTPAERRPGWALTCTPSPALPVTATAAGETARAQAGRCRTSPRSRR